MWVIFSRVVGLKTKVAVSVALRMGRGQETPLKRFLKEGYYVGKM